MLRKIEHDVLELHIAMNHEDIHHIAETGYELVHDLLYDIGRQLPVLHLHQLLQVVSVTELHEDVEA